MSFYVCWFGVLKSDGTLSQGRGSASPSDTFPREGAMSPPSESPPKPGIDSPHCLGTSQGEDKRGALVLTPVLHLPALYPPRPHPRSHLRPSHVYGQLVYLLRGPTCRMTFSGLGEMKHPFLNCCRSRLEVRILELGHWGLECWEVTQFARACEAPAPPACAQGPAGTFRLDFPLLPEPPAPG